MPIAMDYFLPGHYHQLSTFDYVTGAIPLILAACILLFHSQVARLLVFIWCLLIITWLCWSFIQSQNRSWIFVPYLSLYLWLAWLFSLSPGARAWFPKSPPTPD